LTWRSEETRSLSVSINAWLSVAAVRRPRWPPPGNYSSVLTLCCGMRSTTRNSAVEPSQLGLPVKEHRPQSEIFPAQQGNGHVPVLPQIVVESPELELISQL